MHIVFTLACAVAACCCTSHPPTLSPLEQIGYIIESHPDSALAALEAIAPSSLKSDEERAKHSLLTAQARFHALDNDTAISTLQPAIDYFIEKKQGTPDDRLRACFLTGDMLINNDKLTEAADYLTQGLTIAEAGEATDTLWWGRLLQNQGRVLYQLYDFNGYVANNLKAASLYESIGMHDRRFRALANAYGVACIPNGPQHMADSLKDLCATLADTIGWRQKLALKEDLTYAHFIGSADDTKAAIAKMLRLGDLNGDDYYFLANAYMDAGEPEKGLEMLDRALERDSAQASTLKHLSAKAHLLKTAKRYDEAFEAMRQFNDAFIKFNESKFADERQRIERMNSLSIEKLRQEQRSRLLAICFALTLAIMALAMLLVYFRLRTKSYESETRRLQLLRLEEERDELSRMIEALNKTNIDSEARQVISERLELINTLFAAEIGNEETFARKGEHMLKALTVNSEKFMDSLRIAYTASHPSFMRHLEDCGLTRWEINYCCLYLIGLRGKEIGSYLKMRSHYNNSSAIRRKLGLEESGSNLGIYLRRLLNQDQS